MTYTEYLDSGGSKESLIEAIHDHFEDSLDENGFYSRERSRIVCGSREELDQVIDLIEECAADVITIGFNRSDWDNMTRWRVLFVNEEGEVHIGAPKPESESGIDLSALIESCFAEGFQYDAVLCELPDILELLL